LSYARKNKLLADRIENGLAPVGHAIRVTRDIRDVPFRANLQTFMRSIRDHDFALMIVSRDFILSPYCMFEVSEFLQEADFRDRVLPVVTEEADIYSEVSRQGYFRYWDERLAEAIGERDREDLDGEPRTAEVVRDARILQSIRDSLDAWFAYLLDHNAITPETLAEQSYGPLFEALSVEPEQGQLWKRMVEIGRIDETEMQDLAIDRFADEHPRDGRYLRAMIALSRNNYAQALYHCDSYLRHHGPRYPVLILRGRSYDGLGNLGASRKDFIAAIQVDPSLAPGHLLLGTSLAQEGNPETMGLAEAGLLHAIQRDPTLDQAYYNLGCVYEMQGLWEEAERQFGSASILNPDSADNWFNLGLMQERQFKLVEAKDNYRRALAVDLLHAKAHFNMGNIARYEKDRAAARRWYEKALELDERNVDAHVNLGTLLFAEREYDTALDHIRRCLAIDPENALARIYLAKLRELGLGGAEDKVEVVDPRKLAGSVIVETDSGPFLVSQEAEDAPKESTERALPSDLQRGFQLFAQGNYVEAEPALRRALEHSPNEPFLHGLLAGLYEAQLRFGRALFHHRCVLELSDDPQLVLMAHYGMGFAHMELGEFRQAELCYNKALELAPDEAYSHAALGTVLLKRGDLDAAETCLKAALSPDLKQKADPIATQVSALTNLARVYVERELWSEAEGPVKAALRLDPAHSLALDTLADIEGFGRENFPEAERWREKARQMDKGNRLPPALVVPRWPQAPAPDVDPTDTEQVDPYRAHSALRKALELAPDDPELFDQIGGIYFSRRYGALARRQLGQAVRLDPSSVRLRFNLGSMHAYLGDFDSALACFEAALEIDPKDSMAATYAGLMHFQEGRLQPAHRYFIQAVYLDPNNGNALLNLSAWYEKEGDLEQAKTYNEKVLKTDEVKYEDSHRIAHSNLAILYGNRGETEKAAEHRREARRIAQDQV
jgi:tetratricopeptide (TPR) repeat protein